MAGEYGVGTYGEGEVVLSLPATYPDLGTWAGKKPEITDANYSQVEIAERLAWATMIRLTAYRVAVLPVTVRPVCQKCDDHTWFTEPAGFSYLGGFNSDVSLLRGFSFACRSTHHSVPLPRPVGRVVEVRVNDTVVDPAAYRVDENRLVRTDSGAWSTAGGLQVTYYPGHRPDTLFVWATGQLAAEFFYAMGGGGRGQKCRLPSGVTSVVRQGVSYEIENVPFTNGRTGIIEIDAVIARYNPNSLVARPRVASVDSIRRAPRVTAVNNPQVQPSPNPPAIGGQALAQGVTLRITRGADFDGAFVYRAGDRGLEQPVDLTGWTAQGQVRDVVGGTVWLAFSTGQGVTLGADGTVAIHIAHVATEGPEWDARKRGVWDLELTSSSGRRIRFAQGVVEVSQDVTRG